MIERFKSGADWPFLAVEVRRLRDMLDDWLDHMEAM